jgi:hypothetical protein
VCRGEKMTGLRDRLLVSITEELRVYMCNKRGAFILKYIANCCFICHLLLFNMPD